MGKVQALKKSVEKAKELEIEFDYEEVKLHPEEYEVWHLCSFFFFVCRLF